MSNQRNQRFWQVAALAALLLCAYAVFTRGAPPANADNGGAAMEGLIALMGTNVNNEHLYLIDTRSKSILMYESRNGNNFTLVAGRKYDPDLFCLENGVNKELPFRQNGYTTVDIQKAVNQVLVGGKAKNR